MTINPLSDSLTVITDSSLWSQGTDYLFTQSFSSFRRYHRVISGGLIRLETFDFQQRAYSRKNGRENNIDLQISNLAIKDPS